jgi:uncharacterized membrane protein
MTAGHEAQQLERLTFFSDAVFAIAMTLLIVEIQLPHLDVFTDAALGQALLDLIPSYVGFVVSFVVLGRFWVAHHTVLGMLKAANPKLVWSNLLLLLVVAFMPFPTAIVSHYVQLRVGVGFYTGWLVLLGLLNRRLIQVASDPLLIADDVDPAQLRVFVMRSWIPLAIGASAFIMGMITPALALAMLVLGSPVISWAVSRYALSKA